ncbi:crocetin glucosyltransferase, chloroplastic-like [Helianthus annuus]|uniref:crocetin glucosyltransferase, chloroplastic-like n=1 Tax=Helianthus annuus TaxID=4232 RepID=UPI000B909EE5|nr:crocetin glucosyltransferase, chloroplastic-like [Helianthus annuus]
MVSDDTVVQSVAPPLETGVDLALVGYCSTDYAGNLDTRRSTIGDTAKLNPQFFRNGRITDMSLAEKWVSNMTRTDDKEPTRTEDVPVTRKLFVSLDTLNSQDKPTILVNSFDALEEEALKDIDGKLKLVAFGPLIPSAFLDGKDPSDKSFGGDLFEKMKEYMEWMNTKPRGCIVYISFGSVITLSKKQKEAMAQGLLECGRPFLWVIRDNNQEEKDGEDEVSRMDELEELGLIVPVGINRVRLRVTGRHVIGSWFNGSNGLRVYSV